jgi:hypothetical protein
MSETYEEIIARSQRLARQRYLSQSSTAPIETAAAAALPLFEKRWHPDDVTDRALTPRELVTSYAVNFSKLEDRK